jgi:hypothetical protein
MVMLTRLAFCSISRVGVGEKAPMSSAMNLDLVIVRGRMSPTFAPAVAVNSRAIWKRGLPESFAVARRSFWKMPTVRTFPLLTPPARSRGSRGSDPTATDPS